MFSIRSACPGCGGVSLSRIYEVAYSDPGISNYLASYYSRASAEEQAKWLGNGLYSVYRCSGCGLLFQRQVPDDDFMGELYGKWLGHNDLLAPHKPQMEMAYYAYVAQEILQIYEYLRKHGPASGRPEVLDFGLGWGNWAQVARAFGGRVCGVELSPAKRLHLEHLGFDIVTLEELGRAGRRFDLINTEQVVEHLADPVAVAASLVCLLKPGGIVKFSVPDGRRMASRMVSWSWHGAYAQREQLMPLQPLEHLNCFTSDSLDRFAARFGLHRLGLPLGLAVSFPAEWNGPKAVLKGLLRPLKRHLFKRGCYALYRAG